MWLLSRREHSAKELLEKLARKGYPEEEAREALNSMKGYGFQDDARFAAIKARTTAHRTGNRRVAQVLANSGISKELVLEKLEELEPEIDRALRFVKRYEGKELTDALKARVWRNMAARGFSGSVVAKAWAHLNVAASSSPN